MTRTMAAVLATLALLAAGCGGGGDEGVADRPVTEDQPEEPTADQTSPDEAGDRVVVQGFRFQPATLAVPVGTTVTWVNEDDIDHTATAGTPDAPDDAFDVDLAEQGAQGAHTFDEAGTYAYFCQVHTSMTGEIVVG